MSLVTNAILCTSLINENVSDEEINKFSEVGSTSTGQKFVNCNSKDEGKWYGGSKYLETRVMIAAFNYMDRQGWIDHLKSLPWDRPEEVQLFLQEQDDNVFTERLHGDLE